MGLSVVLLLTASLAIVYAYGVAASPPDYSSSVVRMSQIARVASSDEVAEWTRLSDGRSLTRDPPCSCQGKVCGCCQPVKIPDLGIDANACANVTFLSEQIGAKLSLSFDGKILFEKTVSVKNPSPVCVDFHGKFGAQICVELYKMSVSPEEFEGCAKLEAKVLEKEVASVDLGCFKMPFKKTSHVSLLESLGIAQLSLAPTAGDDPCYQSHDQWQCCQRVTIKELGMIDSPVCVKVKFLPTTLEVSLTLTVNGEVVTRQAQALTGQVSACVTVLRSGVCVSFDLSLSLQEFSGCISLEADIFGQSVARLDLWCFRIPLQLAVYGRSRGEGPLRLGRAAETLGGLMGAGGRGGPIGAENFPLTIALEPYVPGRHGGGAK